MIRNLPIHQLRKEKVKYLHLLEKVLQIKEKMGDIMFRRNQRHFKN
jgi:hypothetical protein